MPFMNELDMLGMTCTSWSGRVNGETLHSLERDRPIEIHRHRRSRAITACSVTKSALNVGVETLLLDC